MESVCEHIQMNFLCKSCGTFSECELPNALRLAIGEPSGFGSLFVYRKGKFFWFVMLIGYCLTMEVSNSFFVLDLMTWIFGVIRLCYVYMERNERGVEGRGWRRFNEPCLEVF